jgi:hypothetical protein
VSEKKGLMRKEGKKMVQMRPQQTPAALGRRRWWWWRKEGGGHKRPKYQYSLWVRSHRIPFLWQKAVFWTLVVMSSKSNCDKNYRDTQSIKAGLLGCQRLYTVPE